MAMPVLEKAPADFTELAAQAGASDLLYALSEVVSSYSRGKPICCQAARPPWMAATSP